MTKTPETTKTDLLNILNDLDNDTSLSYEDIPDYIVADTYFYQVTDNPREILKNIAKGSKNLSTKIWDDRDISIPLKNINELFILASIVEKETFLNEEKPIISGVFYNRLKKNMRLQSDPTVEFSITLGQNKLGRKLLRKDPIGHLLNLLPLYRLLYLLVFLCQYLAVFVLRCHI